MKTALPLFVVGALLCSCDAEEPLPSAADLASAVAELPAAPLPEVPLALARLVPVDAVAFVYVESLDTLTRMGHEVIDPFQGPEAVELDAALLFEGGAPWGWADAALVDSSAGLGFALGLPGAGGLPVTTLIVPVTDTTAFLASHAGPPGGPAPRVDGNYVGISQSPDYGPAEGPSALTKGLVAGQISLRIDAQTVLGAFRPLIDMGLAQVEREIARESAASGGTIDLGLVMESYFDVARAVLDSAGTLDLGLSLVDGDLLLQGALTTLQGSPMASFASEGRAPLASLAQRIDPAEPFVFAVGGDMDELMAKTRDWFLTVMRAYPEPMRSGLDEYLASFDSLYPLFGDGMVGSFGFEAEGFRLAAYVESPRVEELMEGYRRALQTDALRAFGLSTGEPRFIQIAGRDVVEYRMDFDPSGLTAALAEGADAAEVAKMESAIDELFGGGGVLPLVMATEGDCGAWVLGGDGDYLLSSLGRLEEAPNRLPDDLARALDVIAEGNPALLYRVDIARVLAQIGGLAGEQLPLGLAEHSTPLNFFAGVEGRVWRGGLSVNVQSLARLTELLESP